MQPSTQQVKCSKCDRTLLDIEHHEEGSVVTSPPSGAILLLVNPEQITYEVLCATCGHAQQFTSRFILRIKGCTNSEPNSRNALSLIGGHREKPTDLLFPKVRFGKLLAVADRLKDTPFSACVSALASNMSRVAAIGRLTVRVAGLSRRLRIVDDKLRHRVSLAKETGEEFKWDSDLGVEIIRQLREKSQLFSEAGLATDRMGNREMHLWSRAHRDVELGISTTLSVQIALVWSAFEILAADLWVTAVNLRPNPLAIKFGKSLQGPGKSIPISVLGSYGKYDFNTSNMMGNILRDTRKADFTSLMSIREVYASTFGKRVEAIESPYLAVLEVLRNLIMHSAGVVDKTCIERVKDYGLQQHPMCVAFRQGEYFEIDASLASGLARKATQASISLIEYVAEYVGNCDDPTNPGTKNPGGGDYE